MDNKSLSHTKWECRYDIRIGTITPCILTEHSHHCLFSGGGLREVVWSGICKGFRGSVKWGTRIYEY